MFIRNSGTPAKSTDRQRWEQGRRRVAARVRKERRTQPSAREWFAILRPMLLDSRPVIGKTEWGDPIYGKPTFRNVIDPETGEHL